jgi:hypothetical protein
MAMYFKFTLTNKPEPWGQGIHDPSKVVLFDRGRFALKQGVKLAEIENPTIAIEPLEGEELEAFTAQYELPDGWIPTDGAPEPGK